MYSFFSSIFFSSFPLTSAFLFISLTILPICHSMFLLSLLFWLVKSSLSPYWIYQYQPSTLFWISLHPSGIIDSMTLINIAWGNFSKNGLNWKKYSFISFLGSRWKMYCGNRACLWLPPQKTFQAGSNFFALSICKISLLRWLIDFKSMSSLLGLFYAKRLGNCVHCTFIFILFCIVSKKFLAHGYMISSIPIQSLFRLTLDRNTWYHITVGKKRHRHAANEDMDSYR